ncbi:hypothetical protein [Mycobacteroides abscessus]
MATTIWEKWQMGIIRTEDRNARDPHILREQQRIEREASEARAVLQERLPWIIEKITNDARKLLRLTGSVSSVVMRLPAAMSAVEKDSVSMELVKTAMLEVEPQTSAVGFRRDYFLDYENPIFLKVSFDPPLT